MEELTIADDNTIKADLSTEQIEELANIAVKKYSYDTNVRNIEKIVVDLGGKLHFHTFNVFNEKEVSLYVY